MIPIVNVHRLDLDHHVKEEHQTVEFWFCSACNKSWTHYTGLNHHITRYHQEGIFRCTKENCNFVDDTRTKVIDHYGKQHSTVEGTGKKETECKTPVCVDQRKPLDIKPLKYKVLESKCPISGCDRIFQPSRDYYRHLLERHEILHYRCMLVNCSKSFHSM